MLELKFEAQSLSQALKSCLVLMPELCSFPCGGEERHKFGEVDWDQLKIGVLKGVGETEKAVICFKLF